MNHRDGSIGIKRLHVIEDLSRSYHEPNELTYADGQLQIRVVDLNADAKRRDEILAQKPDWLTNEADLAGYLRGRVLVNVFEKFQIEILDASQAACLTVPQ